MHPVATLTVENARKYHRILAPIAYVVFLAIANVHVPVQQQLLVASASWTLVYIPTIWAGLREGNEGKRTTGWLAGGFLALSQICCRAACDREGILSTKGLLPLFVVLLSENELLSKYFTLPMSTSPAEHPNDVAAPSAQRSFSRPIKLLAVTTVSASIALSTQFSAPPTSALGISSIIFAATGLVLFESVLKSTRNEIQTSRRGLVSANSTFSQPASSSGPQKEQAFAALRDVAAVMALVCGVAAYFLEPKLSPNTISWEPVYRQSPEHWKSLLYHRTVQQVLLMICINVVANFLLFFVLCQQGAVHTSFLSTAACISAKLRLATSFTGIWFTVIYGSSSLLFLFSTTSPTSSSFVDVRNSMRFRRIVFGATTLSIGLVLYRHISGSYNYISLPTGEDGSGFFVFPPEKPFEPVPMDLTKGHPAAQLIDSAERDFNDVLKRQSKSLGDATQEYRRRHGMAPPPHFDKWYEFATRNKVVLIDEYDTITQALLPYWALKPATVRSRIKNALGHEDSALIGVMIRNGNVVKIENGDEWQQQATTGMMKDFVQFLPDMDLGFNIHDEPRVIVPNDHLSAMIAKAKDKVLPRVMKKQSPKNAFSARPSDMNDGKRFEETSTTRFNRFAHQQTWTHSRLSCPADSQAQKFEDQVADNLTAYAASPLVYVYNQTAFSDICNSPSLSSTFGFFERPNAFNIIHELTPVFSQSKISSFQDILYPSPWYWFGKVEYEEARDTSWGNKTNSLYWRGSTTGGFSRNGGWRRQHRQRVVRRINAPDKASILTSDTSSLKPTYSVAEVDRRRYEALIDVKFSHIGQCDPGDCEAQKEFFKTVERVDGADAWYFKHLLDMDGNAFSGRFYAFLKSKSLTYKMAVFREWHQDWLRPWVHYIPLSLIGDEHLDLVQWFAGGGNVEPKNEEKMGKDEPGGNKGGNGDSLGERKAREIAERSTEWAGRVLRNVDLEAWFFRLLLEYGRIIDDDRESIGYAGP